MVTKKLYGMMVAALCALALLSSPMMGMEGAAEKKETIETLKNLLNESLEKPRILDFGKNQEEQAEHNKVQLARALLTNKQQHTTLKELSDFEATMRKSLADVENIIQKREQEYRSLVDSLVAFADESELLQNPVDNVCYRKYRLFQQHIKTSIANGTLETLPRSFLISKLNMANKYKQAYEKSLQSPIVHQPLVHQPHVDVVPEPTPAQTPIAGTQRPPTVQRASTHAGTVAVTKTSQRYDVTPALKKVVDQYLFLRSENSRSSATPGALTHSSRSRAGESTPQNLTALIAQANNLFQKTKSVLDNSATYIAANHSAMIERITAQRNSAQDQFSSLLNNLKSTKIEDFHEFFNTLKTLDTEVNNALRMLPTRVVEIITTDQSQTITPEQRWAHETIELAGLVQDLIAQLPESDKTKAAQTLIGKIGEDAESLAERYAKSAQAKNNLGSIKAALQMRLREFTKVVAARQSTTQPNPTSQPVIQTPHPLQTVTIELFTFDPTNEQPINDIYSEQRSDESAESAESAESVTELLRFFDEPMEALARYNSEDPRYTDALKLLSSQEMPTTQNDLNAFADKLRTALTAVEDLAKEIKSQQVDPEFPFGENFGNDFFFSNSSSRLDHAENNGDNTEWAAKVIATVEKALEVIKDPKGFGLSGPNSTTLKIIKDALEIEKPECLLLNKEGHVNKDYITDFDHENSAAKEKIDLGIATITDKLTRIDIALQTDRLVAFISNKEKEYTSDAEKNACTQLKAQIKTSCGDIIAQSQDDSFYVARLTIFACSIEKHKKQLAELKSLIGNWDSHMLTFTHNLSGDTDNDHSESNDDRFDDVFGDSVSEEEPAEEAWLKHVHKTATFALDILNRHIPRSEEEKRILEELYHAISSADKNHRPWFLIQDEESKELLNESVFKSQSLHDNNKDEIDPIVEALEKGLKELKNAWVKRVKSSIERGNAEIKAWRTSSGIYAPKAEDIQRMNEMEQILESVEIVVKLPTSLSKISLQRIFTQLDTSIKRKLEDTFDHLDLKSALDDALVQFEQKTKELIARRAAPSTPTPLHTPPAPTPTKTSFARTLGKGALFTTLGAAFSVFGYYLYTQVKAQYEGIEDQIDDAVESVEI